MPSIRSTIGNFEHLVHDTISSVLASARTQIQNLVGTATSRLSNIWSGGFTGMSEQGMADLKAQLSSYCQDVQDLIDSFDQTGDITSALRGEVQTAAYDFIAAIKSLLQAYVSTMRQEIDEADEAYRNFASSDKSISQDVESSASDIRSNANNIRLD